MAKKENQSKILVVFDEILIKTNEIIRPNRKFERKKYRCPDKKNSTSA
jgi:hypothetical protein